MAVYRITPPQNPLARVLAAIVALAVLAGAFMLGLVVFAVVAGLALVLGVVAWVRGLLVRRRMRRGEAAPGARSRQSEVIEAEYTVISRRREP